MSKVTYNGKEYEQIAFNSSTSWTVPKDCKEFDAFLVGSGAGNAYSSNNGYCSGGGGFTKTFSKLVPHPGEIITITVGATSAVDCVGNPSSIVYSAGTLTANGATGGNTKAGGSGGGGNGNDYYGSAYGAAGGSNGSNGSTASDGVGGYGGSGQGTTTRAFADASGILYAGGGGGASIFNDSTSTHYAPGGTGGGGTGGCENTKGYHEGTSGTPNTGGGAGAGFTTPTGGSGIVLIRYIPFKGEPFLGFNF